MPFSAFLSANTGSAGTGDVSRAADWLKRHERAYGNEPAASPEGVPMQKSDDGDNRRLGRHFRRVRVWDCKPSFAGQSKPGIAVAGLMLVTDEGTIYPHR